MLRFLSLCVLLFSASALLALGGGLGDLAAAPASLGFGAPTLRHAEGGRSIEWGHSHNGLNLLIHRPKEDVLRPQLYPFDADTSVAAVLSSALPASLLEPRTGDSLRCAVIGADGKPVDKSKSLGVLLQAEARADGSNALRLECVSRRASGAAGLLSETLNRRHRFAFHSFVEPQTNPNEIRSRNELRRSLTGEAREYPFDSTELISNKWAGLWGWVQAFVKHHWGPLREYPSYEDSPTGQTGRWHLNTGAVLRRGDAFGDESDSEVRLGIVSDWAAGTREADYVQGVMMYGNGTNSFNPHWTVHIGDVYYVGAPEEIASNMLGIAPPGAKRGVKWPHGSIGSFAVEGNHEMYSRGFGFFDTLLPTLGVRDPQSGLPQGQHSGSVAMENKYWRIIMLDTGYRTYDVLPMTENRNNTQPEVVMDWLRREVQLGDPNDKRGIIFMTHHQAESGFENPFLATPQQIASIMPPGRTVLWLWGHEHRLSFYKLRQLENSSVPLNFYGRCVGNSGFPNIVERLPDRAKSAGLHAYDDRLYEVQTGFLPLKIGFAGFSHLTLNKESASLRYSTLAIDPSTGQLSGEMQTDMVQEMFHVDAEGNVNLSSFAILNQNITIVQ